MGVVETFSKRQRKRERAGQPDVYQYDSLPEAFRIQVVHIWKTAIGPFFAEDAWSSPAPASNHVWRSIHATLARELGVFYLGNQNHNEFAQCQEFLLKADTNGALDIIELSFRVIDRMVRKLYDYDRQRSRITQAADDAIEELNHRFREHGIGYQFVEDELVRVDSQYLHSEVVKPALALLNDQGFRGAADEFLKAHEHHRKGRNKEAIAEALKAFESTMKSICDARKWSYPSNATAKPLIELMVSNGLAPRYLESHFAGLRAAMESGLPTVRDKTSAHGQGAEPQTVPPHVAAYALHLAASNIVFLVEAHRSL